MALDDFLRSESLDTRGALLALSGPPTYFLLSNSWHAEALAAITSLRVHARAPLETILAAVRRRRGLCHLDLSGCCFLDGDGAMAQVLDVLRAAGRTQLRGLHLAGTPFGRRTAQGVARLGVSCWAFPARAIERGCVLIGHPSLASATRQAQPHLDKAVVILTDHHPERGTEGLVLNQPMSMQLRGLAAGSSGLAPGGWSPTFDACALHFAGDASEAVSVLHGLPDVGGLEVSPGLFLVRGSEEIRKARLGVERGKFAVESFQWLYGSCRWGPGCLQQELQAGLWHSAHCDSRFILQGGTTPESLWSDLKILVT